MGQLGWAGFWPAFAGTDVHRQRGVFTLPKAKTRVNPENSGLANFRVEK